MRCNQVSIYIERFGKYVPKNYPANVQRISVYCDDYDSIYTALSKAYALAINELAEHESIGARTDVYTNEFSTLDHRELHGCLLEPKRKYENDVNLEYYDTDLQLCEDRIWVYENAEEILSVLRECDDADFVVAKLKDRFGLDDYQIRKLSQMRFGMMTQKDYMDAKNKVEIRKAAINNEGQRELYRKIEKRRIELEIEKLKAYFLLVEHYDEIAKLVIETESTRDLEKLMQEKFGFSRMQAESYKYFSLNEFSRAEQERKKKALENLENKLRKTEICPE